MFTAPGADYGHIYSVQRNESRRVFGETAFNLPGRTDIKYPNISKAYLKRLLPYWVNEVNKALDHMGAIPDSAIVDAWVRAEHDRLKPLEASIRSMPATNDLISQSLAKYTWDTLDAVVLPMRAIRDTPSKWEILQGAIGDSFKDLLNNLPWWVKAAAVVVVGAHIYKVAK